MFGALINQSITDSLPVAAIIQPLSLALDLVGVAIIAYGAIVSLVFLVQVESRDVKQAGLNQHSIKQQFTSRILTGLEFFIAGDVLKTVLNPTVQSLEVVAIIVAIRAALTFLLNSELKDEEKLRSAGQKGLEAAEGKTSKRTKSDRDETAASSQAA